MNSRGINALPRYSLKLLRMVAISKVLAVSALATSVFAGKDGVKIYHKGELAVNACQRELPKIATLFSKKDKKKFCNVRNQPALGSMVYCLNQTGQKDSGDYFLKRCKRYNLTHADLEAALANATNLVVKNVTAYPGFNATKPFWLPVALKQKKVDAAFNSYVGRFYGYNRSHYYSWALLAYWYVLIILAGAGRLIQWIAPSLTHRLHGNTINLYRRYVSIPALGRKKRVELARYWKIIEIVVPSRLETIYIAGWCVLLIVFNFVSYTHEKHNTIWKKKEGEMWSKIGTRTGIIAYYMIPQLFLFAGRNNFLLWISGWSYARLLVIHHWYARLCFLMMFFHTLGFLMSAISIGNGKFTKRNKRPMVRWGYVAVVASFIMCVHSLSCLRKRRYEIFVLSHNVLGAIFVAGAWMHAAPIGYKNFMIACIAVWCFDKAMRLARMAWFGVRTAELELLPDGVLKVTVPRPKCWKPHPLSHAFVYFIRPSCFWQSHPFTLVDSVTLENHVQFYVRVKGGLTHGLCQFVNKQPGQKTAVKCIVEGPYGAQKPLQHYATVAFIAGGCGIPGVYTAAAELGHRGSNQKLRLIWVVRNLKSVLSFYDELKHLENSAVRTTVYVTREKLPETDDDSVETKDTKITADACCEKLTTGHSDENFDARKSLAALSFVEFRNQRPDLETIIKSEIEESSDSIAFVACGHASFVDDGRKAVAENLSREKRVDYFDQMQIW